MKKKIKEYMIPALLAVLIGVLGWQGNRMVVATDANTTAINGLTERVICIETKMDLWESLELFEK